MVGCGVKPPPPGPVKSMDFRRVSGPNAGAEPPPGKQMQAPLEKFLTTPLTRLCTSHC